MQDVLTGLKISKKFSDYITGINLKHCPKLTAAHEQENLPVPHEEMLFLAQSTQCANLHVWFSIIILPVFIGGTLRFF